MAGSDQKLTALASEDAPAGVLVREGVYGDKITTVEPGGAEFIPLHERHGRPLHDGRLGGAARSCGWRSGRLNSALHRGGARLKVWPERNGRLALAIRLARPRW